MSSTQIVSATMGAMNPLLSKLTALMGDEYKKLTGVRKQAAFLKDELSSMKALLEKLELMDELDPLATNWRDHVREMSYDMENCIDEFMRNLGGADADAGVIKKAVRRLKNLGKRQRIANRIEELKVLALEASERRVRYKIDDCVNSSPRTVAVDPQLTDAEKKFKVVSVVGFGGLGKTTLAKQVYDKIGGQFSCKAFVSVLQRPDMKSLLSSLQLKLGMQKSPHTHEVQDIIDSIRNHIKHKRYLIVIDDLWDQSAWNTINCAFAEDGNGGRVIVTTRVDDVALWACGNDRECIYRMEPLKEQDSAKLFFNRVFGSEDGCPHQLKDVSAEILKKCGGLPLAIITVASLLASCQASSRNEWESIRNSLGAKLAAKPTLEEMRSILNLSYMHLPPHLRTCFLYLGMYPEDHKIWRDDLVRQWVAEGFVSDLDGTDLENVAKNYFNELINRSLVQPASVQKIISAVSHILVKTLQHCMAAKCEHKVRRLSLKLSAGGPASRTIATNLSQV